MDTKKALLATLIQCGYIKEDNEMIRFTCYDRLMEIRMVRTKVSRFAAVDHQYICTLILFDTIAQRELLRVSMSEACVLQIVDSIYQWAEFGMSYEMAVPSDMIQTNGNYYMFVFEKLFQTDEDIEENLYAMNINEYVANMDTIVNRAHIRFKIGDSVITDGDLMDFVDILYFAFLVDLDMGNNLPDPYNYIF